MNKEFIKEYLYENGYSDIEEIKSENVDNCLILKFFYDFDDEEIKAARAYANDECEDEAEGEEWYGEFFGPYLSDLAADNTGEVLEDIMEKLEIKIQFASFELDEEDYGYNEIVAIFFEKDLDLDIDDVFEKLDI